MLLLLTTNTKRPHSILVGRDTHHTTTQDLLSVLRPYLAVLYAVAAETQYPLQGLHAVIAASNEL